MSETQFKLKTAYCRDYDVLLRFRYGYKNVFI